MLRRLSIFYRHRHRRAFRAQPRWGRRLRSRIACARTIIMAPLLLPRPTGGLLPRRPDRALLLGKVRPGRYFGSSARVPAGSWFWRWHCCVPDSAYFLAARGRIVSGRATLLRRLDNRAGAERCRRHPRAVQSVRMLFIRARSADRPCCGSFTSAAVEPIPVRLLDGHRPAMIGIAPAQAVVGPAVIDCGAIFVALYLWPGRSIGSARNAH